MRLRLRNLMPPILLFVRFEFNIYGLFQVWKFITLAPRLTYGQKQILIRILGPWLL